MKDKDKEFKIIIDCPLCNSKELNVVGGDKNLMQCISCGYSTSDDYTGTFEDNNIFKNLDKKMKEWAVESNGQIWIPSILNLPIGIFYPVDGKNKSLHWAFAPIEKIPKEEQKNYPLGDGKFYDQKYDIDNQIIFDSFGSGIIEINMIMELRNKSKNNTVSDKNG